MIASLAVAPKADDDGPVRAFAGSVGDLRLEGVIASISGSRRRSYGDAYAALISRGLFAVADGVSTLPGSAAAADRIVRNLERQAAAMDRAFDEKGVLEAIRRINGRIFAEGRGARTPDAPGAATLSGLALDAARQAMTLFSVGDSSVWLQGDGDMRRVTTPDVDPETGRLRAAVGAKPVLNPWVRRYSIGESGAALIATDGYADLEAIAAHAWFRMADDDILGLFERIADAAPSDDVTMISLRWRRER